MPPTDLSTTEVLDRLDARDARATAERHDQTTAFTTALRDQTSAFSVIVERESALARGELSRIARLGTAVLCLLIFGVLALAGVSVKYGGAPGTLELSPANVGAAAGVQTASASPPAAPVPVSEPAPHTDPPAPASAPESHGAAPAAAPVGEPWHEGETAPGPLP